MAEQLNGMPKPGDVFFSNTMKKGSNRKAPQYAVKGHAFGVLLGIVPPFQKDPQQHEVSRLLGTVGLLMFDDVADFLGNEAGAKCIKMFEDKYYGKEMPPDTEVIEVPNEGSALVDAQGAPLEKDPNPLILVPTSHDDIVL